MEAAIPGPPSQPRYKQLDSLRGLAALFVFIGHFWGIQFSMFIFNAVKATPLGVLYNGTSAVMFFFVLSGFVISLPFVNAQKTLFLTAFYVKRIFRIYPAFIFAILVSLLLKQFFFVPHGMIAFSEWIKSFWTWNWDADSIAQTLKTLLLIGPDFDSKLIDPPVWSLVIEMKMSVILPFFIIITSRNSAILNVGLLVIITWLTYQYDSWVFSVFYMGVVMAKYKDYLLSKISTWPVIGVIASLLLAVLLYNNNLELLPLDRHLISHPISVLSNYLIAVGSCIIVIIVIAKQKLTRFFEHRALTFLGDISYSFYLVHMPVLIAVSSIFSNRFTYSLGYIFVITLALSVTLAHLMFVFIEKPFQKMGAKLVARYPLLNAVNIGANLKE
ncbi:peptidoglycan/LPS O-acetylase OafA/YrhL [Mucilaginibacter gracilis]|uniref:Peptidoglycan/LPS O-acetylase OafA/YrhL n=1 Tax=Mucilaginibacter gracilis TaxID=423350 RepID=A0A495J9G8_9SPHI|nr:acyltransferase [Mucilaginibacter gracilis]RKR85044.1 peptidoglycan/LPS O-acetylase OafA/YrhL [Mucilaginibacter gracilis]